jgi:hypothetical protein
MFNEYALLDVDIKNFAILIMFQFFLFTDLICDIIESNNSYWFED